MEKYLQEAFDYQRFENNAQLRSLIDQVHARYMVHRLSDDEVEAVAAAGMPGIQVKPIQEKDHNDGFGAG